MIAQLAVGHVIDHAPAMRNGRSRIITPPLIAIAIAIGLGCGASQSGPGASARVSKAHAEKVALSRTPGGSVKESELETEHGRLVWSFDIATPGTADITEVQVDATTGAIVSVEKEGPEQQQIEKEQDAREKKQ